MKVAIDTETTGLDLRHSCRPFFVTMCYEDQTQLYWEWDVEPLTRMPVIPEEDKTDIKERIASASELVLHNTKFDYAALLTIIPDLAKYWDWDKVRDTLILGHLISSNTTHNLTDMAMRYLQVDIEPVELELKNACNEVRRLVRSNFPAWKIARDDDPGLPSAKGNLWGNDMWLPRAFVKELWEGSAAGQAWYRRERLHNECRDSIAVKAGLSRGTPWGIVTDKLEEEGRQHLLEPLGLSIKDSIRRVSKLNGWEFHPPSISTNNVDPYWTALSKYSNADSAVTIALNTALEDMMYRRKLEKIYRERLKCLRIAWMMEHSGLTMNESKRSKLVADYQEESSRAGATCVGIAESMGHSITLPKTGNNGSLIKFVFGSDGLNLPAVKTSKKTGVPSLDAKCLEAYEGSLPERSKARRFVECLRNKRKRDTALTYMQGYLRFALPTGHEGYYRLHPSLNPTGTDTLRWSSSNPNEQNISKREGFNIRYCFGPLPGREWYSIDAQNIELRIPAYEVGEQEMIDLFERPNDAPYFGSNHLLVSHILHKELFEQCVNDQGQIDGRIFKKKYASTWYQWVKNGNFAVTYGAVAESGTADRAYHVEGGQLKVEARFGKIKELNLRCIRMAEKYGYVETIPDRSVDPERGYPILCSRTDYGKIKPTVPLNYHIQGSAMWWTMKAMIRVQELLDTWNRKAKKELYRIALQVHDELVLDFPKSRIHPKEELGTGGRLSNLWRVRECQRVMALGGDDMGIPTPTSAEYHEDNWSEGVTL